MPPIFSPAAVPAQSPARSTTDRNSRLDACRIAASVAILWMHTWESAYRGQIGEIGRFAVPFFSASAFYLLMRSFISKPNRPFLRYVGNRFYRLYLPFLGWGVLGALLMYLKHHFISHEKIHLNVGEMLITGASFQLWFLPFLLVCSILFFPIGRFSVNLPGHARIIFALVLATAGIWISRSSPPILVPDASSYWLQFAWAFWNDWGALPSVLLGIALALVLNERAMPAWAAWIGLLVCIASCIYCVTIGRYIPYETAGGLGLLLFSLSGQANAFTRLCSRFTYIAYGIYLSQNVVLEPTQTILSRLHVRATTINEIGVFAFVLLATTALSILLRQSAFTRWLLG